MEIKKYPDAKLENYSKVLILLGFVFALFLVYEFMKMKSYPREVAEITGKYIISEESVQIVEVKPIELQKPPVERVVVPEKILKVEDDTEIIETVLETTETDELDIIEFNMEEDITNVEEEEVIVEDVPFVIIEEVPVYPGCKGNNKELKACFSTQITAFVQKKFNADLASDLGLESGSIQKIFVVFKIDTKGNITDIKARAPHVRLQKEAIRVVSLLPKMKPGMQRGVAVRVSYSLPIVFRVE